MGISDRVTPYRLTILGLIVTLVLPVPVLMALGRDPREYVVFVGPALGIVIAVFRNEQNAVQNSVQHQQNQDTLGKLVYDNEAFRAALQELQKPDSTIADAARIAVEQMPPPPPTPPTPAEASPEGT